MRTGRAATRAARRWWTGYMSTCESRRGKCRRLAAHHWPRRGDGVHRRCPRYLHVARFSGAAVCRSWGRGWEASCCVKCSAVQCSAAGGMVMLGGWGSRRLGGEKNSVSPVTAGSGVLLTPWLAGWLPACLTLLPPVGLQLRLAWRSAGWGARGARRGASNGRARWAWWEGEVQAVGGRRPMGMGGK